jgi:hypothetical protein
MFRSARRVRRARRAADPIGAPTLLWRAAQRLSIPGSVADAADGVHREAIERLERTRVCLESARAHLVYPSGWRDRRRLDAGITSAYRPESLTTMGARALAGPAERELPDPRRPARDGRR